MGCLFIGRLCNVFFIKTTLCSRNCERDCRHEELTVDNRRFPITVREYILISSHVKHEVFRTENLFISQETKY